MKEQREIKLKENKNNLEKELKLNDCEYKVDIAKIKSKYDNEIISKKYQYEKNINEINNKYKNINEYINIIYKHKIENLDNQYIKIIQKYNFNNKLEKMKNIKRLNEIIYNAYDIYKNNYYNAININNILMNYYNNKTNMSVAINDEYEI